WAPPGNYAVVLTVNGRSFRQPLVVQPDPRVRLAQAAYQREFDLARKVEAESVKASQALDEATELLKKLEQRKKGAASSLQAQIASAVAQGEDISGAQLETDPRNSMGSPARNAASLRALSGDLDKLEGAVDGADADPGPDARASYAVLSKTLTATLSAWQQWKARAFLPLGESGGTAGKRSGK